MKNILLAATALAMLSGAAFAQSTSSTGSNASATNLSGSMSSAKVSSTGSSSAMTNVYLPSGGGATDPSAGSQNLSYGGSYTVRNTPDVIAPNVAGGNPCAVGASGGIGLPGFGLTAGGTWADKACELRQKVALLYNMGEPALAREMMCQDDPKLRAAMLRLGKPCGVDLVRAQASSASPAPTIAPAAAPAHAAAVLVTSEKPEWCKRASPSTEASRDYFVKECT